jgi:hypothetical protein
MLSNHNLQCKILMHMYINVYSIRLAMASWLICGSSDDRHCIGEGDLQDGSRSNATLQVMQPYMFAMCFSHVMLLHVYYSLYINSLLHSSHRLILVGLILVISLFVFSVITCIKRCTRTVSVIYFHVHQSFRHMSSAKFVVPIRYLKILITESDILANERVPAYKVDSDGVT